MRNVVALSTVGFSGVALASFVAVRWFHGALHELATLGRGIETVALGMGEAARFPLFAAVFAALATVLALLLMAQRTSAEPADVTPARVLWPIALSLAGAIASVLLFRAAVAFVLVAITPGAAPGTAANIQAAVENRILFTSVAIAVCFAVAVLQFLKALRLPRGRAPRGLRLIAAALVVSLGVSATLVVYLRSYSARSMQVVATGPVELLPDLPPQPNYRQPARR